MTSVTVRARTGLWMCENRIRKRPRMKLKAPRVGFQLLKQSFWPNTINSDLIKE